jgi:GNAT superfamily N-acetyltransferase
MKIRTAADAAAIAALHAASWQSAYRGILSDDYLDNQAGAERAALWEQRFREPVAGQYAAVAEIDGALAGFVCIFGAHDPQWGSMIDNLHVAQSHKRHGLGAALMTYAAAWCVDGYPGLGVFLWVLEANAPARAFYERMGGVRVGEDIWQPPGGGEAVELRYFWADPAVLLKP